MRCGTVCVDGVTAEDFDRIQRRLGKSTASALQLVLTHQNGAPRVCLRFRLAVATRPGCLPGLVDSITTAFARANVEHT